MGAAGIGIRAPPFPPGPSTSLGMTAMCATRRRLLASAPDATVVSLSAPTAVARREECSGVLFHPAGDLGQRGLRGVDRYVRLDLVQPVGESVIIARRPFPL